jgi:hypothetical protein
MALIFCTECGQQISDKAAACPRCGSPGSTSSNPIRDSVIQLEKALFDEVQKFSARIRELASFARRPSPPSAPPSPDIPDQIRKLAKLKDDGIISSGRIPACRFRDRYHALRDAVRLLRAGGRHRCGSARNRYPHRHLCSVGAIQGAFAFSRSS